MNATESVNNNQKDIKKIVILGAPTYRELHQLITDINAVNNNFYEVIALLDDNEDLHGTHICGTKVIGPLKMAHEFPQNTLFALAINNYKRRIQRIEIIRELGIEASRFPALIHPSAVIDPSTKIGNGSLIFQFCSTANGVKIGEFCMLSPYSLFALDCQIGMGVLTGARVTALGNTCLNSCSFIGSGTVVTENITVGAGAFVGAGTLLSMTVLPGHFTMGHPATEQIRNIYVPDEILLSEQ